MSNLTPTPGWDNVPQLELTTLAQGGPGGPMNSQAQALLNRSEKLKQDGDSHDSRISALESSDQTIGGTKTFEDSPVVPTAADGDSSGNAASTEFVSKAVDAVRVVVSVLDFGAKPNGAQSTTEMRDALTAAWNSALTNGHDLYAPEGVYDTGNDSMPWRQQVAGALLDCKNVTIYGAGPATVFKTTSTGGADVFQLNGLKNFHARNLRITGALTGTSGAGSNGISITSGFDNISLLDIWVDNMPSLDKGAYIDGGKALTLQNDGATNEVGTLVARIFAKGCAQGFGFESNLSSFLGKKASVDVEIIAEDCYAAVIFVAGAATGAIPVGATSGIRVVGQAINCQKDVLINRAHGIEVDVQAITTKTATARTQTPSGATWFAGNLVVEALNCGYAKDARIRVTGNKGGCHYKAQIGGATAGASGQSAATERCDIYLDVGGTPTVSAVNDINSGGATMSNSRLFVSQATASTAGIPDSFYATANANYVAVGPANRFVSPTVAGSLGFAFAADGKTSTGAVGLFDSQITGLQGKYSTTTGAVVTGLYDAQGIFRFGVLNGNGIVIDAMGTSGALGGYVGKHPIYNKSGALVGYIPIYN